MTATTAPLGAELPASYQRRATSWLVITTLAYFLLNGAQLFETAVIVPVWTAAPPDSLALFHGPHGLDMQAFWIIAHTLHELTFLLAIVFTWRIAPVRKILLVLLAAHVTLRVWTVAYFAPLIIEFQQATGIGVSADLAERAGLWQDLNYLRVALFIAISIALLPLVARTGRGPRAASPR